MRRITAVLFIAVVVFGTFSIALADSRTAKDCMAEGIRAAYDNMHLVYQAYYDAKGNLEEQSGGFVAVYQEWDENENVISRTYLDENCEPIQLQVPYIFWNIKFGEDGWSEWLEPKQDTENACFLIGSADLGAKKVGDQYICQVEVEFEGIEPTENQSFWFRAQGAVDGSWSIGNVWNDGLVSLREPPEDNIFKYSTVDTITEQNVQANTFDLGFRCDYWRTGRFRVKSVGIVKQ